MKHRKIIHDKSIYLIVISIAMTLAFFIFGVFIYLSVHDSEMFDFHYENEKTFTLVGQEEVSETIDNTPTKDKVENIIRYLSNMVNCNVSIDAESMVGSAGETRILKIYLNQGEEVSEQLQKKYFKYSETDEPYVFIGAELLYMVDDGRVNINAQNIKVAGVLENKTIRDDNRIVLLNGMNNPGIREVVLNTLANANDYTSLYLGSNQDVFFDIDFDGLKNQLEKLNRDVEVEDGIEDSEVNNLDETIGELTDRIFLGLTFFALINLISLNVVWFNQKRGDIAIMKTYGYSTNQLVAMFSKEYLVAVVAGTVISVFVSIIWYILSGKKASLAYFGEAYTYSLFMIGFIVLLMLLFAVHYAEKVTPANGIKER